MRIEATIEATNDGPIADITLTAEDEREAYDLGVAIGKLKVLDVSFIGPVNDNITLTIPVKP